MFGFQKAFYWVFLASTVSLAAPRLDAQEDDATRITEEDKKVFKDFMEGAGDVIKAKRQKALQAMAISNLRQIGLALFEFESEYGTFPDEKTAVAVKQATETKADLKAATANDCFFQLIAAGMVGTDRLFSFEVPAGKQNEKPEKLMNLDKCAFSYLSGMNAAGNPSRPLVVVPLVKGKTTFDPAILGGRAIVLRVDNSVQSFPIEKDGRVLIEGLDLFDPAQPFWEGKVPPIRWPKD